MKSRKPKSAKVQKGQTHTDGPAIPPALLGELRASFKRFTAATAAVEEHNARGQAIAREAVNAQAIHEHYVEKLKVKLSVKDGDLMDLDRGVVRLLIERGS